MRWLTFMIVFAIGACSADAVEGENPNDTFRVEPVARFDQPWAMTFLPDGRLLVTEKRGALKLVSANGETSAPIDGVPSVAYGGQGGFGDVVLHPDFPVNQQLYLSYAEIDDDGKRGAAVAMARLDIQALELTDLKVIWRQVPKVSGRGHYGHRLAFDEDGYLFISSGERQKFEPSQDMQSNLGKIVRLYDDGRVPESNPFYDQGGVTAEIWSLGHRNPLGLAFDSEGRLWNHEMGPRHGDELNLVLAGKNYGYPIVSNGNHYSGRRIPDHDTRPEFEAPKAYWVPAISPAGLMIYSGTLFKDFTGDAFMGGLSGRTLVRVELGPDRAREVQRFDMDARVREVEQGPEGAIWILEDGDRGRLLRLTPAD